MNPLPFSAGQKVVCVFADFPDAVHGHFDRLPEEGGIYTISEAFLCPEHITKRIIPSVRLIELPPLRPGKSGFSAWRFSRVEAVRAVRQRAQQQRIRDRKPACL